MGTTQAKSVSDVLRALGRYSPDVFEFLHRGLDYTVKRTHGPAPAGLASLLEWLHARGIEPAELPELITKGQAPQTIVAFIDHLGGIEEAARRLNRHVGGEELCWGLRDLAVKEWGAMAAVVLRYWGIRSTKDFGRIVFALVENGLLQKQPHDCIEDFNDVYDFDDALERSYQIDCSKLSEASGDED